MRLQETLTAHRQTLHRIPELGFQEFKTSAYIRETLDTLGIAYDTPLETATVAFLKGNSEQTIGFRADIDGLPIEEENDLPFRSVHTGAMHACGHDGHTAMLLAFAERCRSLQDVGALPHNVLLLFQPSEEADAGANRLIQAYPFGNGKPAAIFGLHLMPDNPEGTLLTKAGPLTASATEYRVFIEGRSAHVANKETGANALGALNFTVSQIQQLQHFFLSGLNQNILHIGKLSAGEAINTVPSSGYLEGTIRTYEPEDLRHIKEKLTAITESADSLFGTSARIEFGDGYPPVVNDSELTAFAAACASDAGLDIVIKEKPYLFGEDFSFYREVAPAHFAFLGVGNAAKGYASGLHTASFNFDEAALVHGVRYFETILHQFGDSK